MSEYIIWESDKTETTDYLGVKHGVSHFEKREEIVRCRDCVAYEPYHTYAGMKLDYGECTQHRRQTDDDRFCWWAERSDR